MADKKRKQKRPKVHVITLSMQGCTNTLHDVQLGMNRCMCGAFGVHVVESLMKDDNA